MRYLLVAMLLLCLPATAQENSSSPTPATTVPLPVFEPVSAPSPEEDGPEVWLLTRGEHLGIADRTTYAVGVGLKWDRTQLRLMTWPMGSRYRIDWGVRIR